MSEMLPLAQIRLDEGIQPRTELSKEVIEEYTLAMTEGAVFPPVTVFHNDETYWLADGFHRCHAARAAGLEEIEAEIREGGRREALLHAVGANATHGMRRTNNDKRRAVLMLLNDEVEWSKWPNTKIANKCSVSEFLVRQIKDSLSSSIKSKMQPSREVTRGGTTYTMNTAAIGNKPEPDPTESAADRAAIEAPDIHQDEPEAEQEAVDEVDETKFILERIKAAYELVDHYSNCKPQEIAGFIDPARRSGALAKKTKRLSNWFKDLGYWLERGR